MILLDPKSFKIIKKCRILKKVECELSLDLGLTKEMVSFNDDYSELIIKNEHFKLPKKIKENTIYVVENNSFIPLMFFSEDTNKFYKLYPTSDWPTITFSSTPMHHITLITPKQSVLNRVNLIDPYKNDVVLDSCFGLGYTAIEMSKRSSKVYTFEIDSNVIKMAKYNPYSLEVFNNPKIEITQGDIFEEINKFEDNFFDVVLHDPPTPKYSPMLYSRDFYKEVLRVLKPGGLFYHYVPLPKIQSGFNFSEELIKRLSDFELIEYNKDAQGFLLKNIKSS